MKHLLTLISCLTFISYSFSQGFEPPEMRFGKGIDEDIEKTDFEIVTDDDAVYLFDKIDYSYSLTETDDLIVELKETYHARIKILTKEGVDLGDLKLRYMHDDHFQKISNIKATSYNLENGKVVATKLSKKDIFDKKLDDRFTEISFAIPNVKEGSIIEYTFVKKTRSQPRPGTWYFSNSYPVVYSQVSFNVPEWYDFSYYHRGYKPFVVQTTEINNQSLGGRYTKVVSNRSTWGKSNIKPFKDEDFTANINDFREQMQFRLNSLKYPGGSRRIFNTTWEKLNANILEDDYTEQLKKTKAIETELPGIIVGKETEEEKIQAIYDYVVKSIEIERDGWIYTSNPLKKVLKEKKGIIADANLLLVNMLQSAGIEAYPMLISTRTDGYLDKLYPNREAFTYPVVYVKTEKKNIIMNATSSYRPYYLPRLVDYNVEGWVVSAENPGWVELESLAPKSVRLYNIEAELSEDGTYNGSVKVTSSNYLGVSDRVSIDEESVEDRIEELYDGNNEITVTNTDSGDTSDAYSSFNFSGDFEIESHAQAVNDFIYFSPLLFEFDTENPFTQEDRTYPVDFPYPRRTVQNISVKLPEGYTLEEQPKPLKISLKNFATFTYIITEKEGTLSIMVQDVLNKTVIQPQDYELLKQYYDAIISAVNSQVTLIKQD